MDLKNDLITVAECWCEATGRTFAQASYQIFKDQRRLDAIARGQNDPRISSYEKAMRWFSEGMPAGVDWPDGVERPQITRKQCTEAAQ